MLPSARRSVTWRVVMSMAVTVAVAVTTRDAVAVPGPVVTAAPPIGCARAGTTMVAAMTAAARPRSTLR